MPADPQFPAPRRQCMAYWCEEDGAPGTILCPRHEALLTPELRTQVRACFASAVGYVASMQMRAAFRTLPQETRDQLAREARKL